MLLSHSMEQFQFIVSTSNVTTGILSQIKSYHSLVEILNDEKIIINCFLNRQRQISSVWPMALTTRATKMLLRILCTSKNRYRPHIYQHIGHNVIFGNENLENVQN